MITDILEKFRIQKVKAGSPRTAFLNLQWDILCGGDTRKEALGYFLSLLSLEPVRYLFLEKIVSNSSFQLEIEHLKLFVDLKFIDEIEKGLYLWHESARDFLRDKLSETVISESLNRDFCTSVYKAVRESPTLSGDSEPELKQDIPHIARVVRDLKSFCDTDALFLLEWLQGSFYKERDYFEQSSESFKSALGGLENSSNKSLTAADSFNDDLPAKITINNLYLNDRRLALSGHVIPHRREISLISSGKKCFRGQNLVGRNFSETDLEEADFSGSNLCDADFSNAILRNANFNGANLSGANLSGSVLVGASLRGANLAKANLHRANLYEATFRRANLTNADLSNSFCSSGVEEHICSDRIPDTFTANFGGAKLAGASLYGAQLQGASLRGTNLSQANLIDANFNHSDLRGSNISRSIASGATFLDAKLVRVQMLHSVLTPHVNLQGADCRESVFCQANLKGAQLYRANLSNSDLSGANLKSSNLNRSECQGTDFSCSNLDESDLRYSNLRGAKFRSASLISAKLSNANLSGAYLSGANARDANLNKAKLSRAQLRAVNLSSANLEEALFRNALLNRANLAKANLTNAVLSGSQLVATNLENAYLNGAKLDQANLSMSSLRGANLTGAYLSNANLSGADLSDACLDEACANGAKMIASVLIRASLKGTHLVRANLRDADLAYSRLSGAKLNRAYLVSCDFSYSEMIGTDLSGAYMLGSCLKQASLAGAILIRTYLSYSKIDGTNLQEADLSGSNLSGVNISSASNILESHFSKNQGLDREMEEFLRHRGAVHISSSYPSASMEETKAFQTQRQLDEVKMDLTYRALDLEESLDTMRSALELVESSVLDAQELDLLTEQQVRLVKNFLKTVGSDIERFKCEMEIYQKSRETLFQHMPEKDIREWLTKEFLDELSTLHETVCKLKSHTSMLMSFWQSLLMLDKVAP